MGGLVGGSILVSHLVTHPFVTPVPSLLHTFPQLPKREKSELFDSNTITPGTPFMDRLATALQVWGKTDCHIVDNVWMMGMCG